MTSPGLVGVQVVGFGPAGIGVAVAADRHGVFERLLAEGLVFLERARDTSTAAAQRFPWCALSNSPGVDFLSSIAENGVFSDVLAGAAARRLAECGASPVWLKDVSLLLEELAARVEQSCRRTCRSAVLYGADVASVSVEEDKTFTSFDAAGHPLVRSRAIVIATGASERLGDADPYARAGARVVASGAVMAGALAPVAACLANGRRVTILGSSHSAFGVADVLLRELGANVQPGQIRIVCRRRAELYFSSADEARSLGLEPEPASICPESAAVNRYNGLRGGARSLCIRVRNAEESRIVLTEDRYFHPSEVSAGDVLISATGYAPRRVRFRTAEGQPLMLRFSRCFGLVNDACQLLSRQGKVMPGAFGIGIGYPRLDAAGRGRIGLNRFHGPDGSEIVGGIVEHLEDRSSTTEGLPLGAARGRRTLEI